MPESGFAYNATKTTTPDNPQRSPKMTSAPIAATTGRLPGDSVRYPTEDETTAPKRHSGNQKLDKRSWEYIIKSGVAGGFAGCAAKTIVAPLDRVKILFQASNPLFQKYSGSWTGAAKAIRDIYIHDGPFGLFRGHSATLIRIFPYAGIKFLAYEQIRAHFIKRKEHETPIRRFASGSLAGMVSVFFTYPLEVIRVRLAFETKREGRSSLSSIVRKIYYEHPPPPPGAVHLDASSASRAAYTTLTSATTTLERAALQRSGITNFFRGFTATLCGMLPYAGSSFLVHDMMTDLMRHPAVAAHTTLAGTARPDKNKPPQLKYWAELSTGGVAGFISQTVSYPLEIIRRRMQVGGVVGDGHRLRMGEVARVIYLEKGWRGFFVGLGIGYVKVVPMVATSFFAYERAKFYLGI